ncbi:hypothetical protein [Kribbella shirazensis]|uniref:Uncharacterized protein n=1 Tax=Kribbella shirazensis TaxID=1105143 RepID=A0A7X5VJ64_9ACTN|nr:hypothetical protein [Kribbella shirazensis]NIK62188.1 hypothetical protein [Kribbella shirazensis]
MDYAEFDAERRRIVRAWGESITDPEALAAAVDGLRDQAGTIQDHAAQARALRSVENLDDLVTEARTPESEYVRRASDVLLESTPPEGTRAEQRARAEAGMAEIARIAAEAPTAGERDAVLEMNEPLAMIVAAHEDSGRTGDAAPSPHRTDDAAPNRGRSAGERAARFAMDPAVAPAGGIAAPESAPASRPGASAESKAPGRNR